MRCVTYHGAISRKAMAATTNKEPNSRHGNLLVCRLRHLIRKMKGAILAISTCDPTESPRKIPESRVCRRPPRREAAQNANNANDHPIAYGRVWVERSI